MATLKATKRTESGSNAVRRLRKAGKLPAVVYGHKQEPLSVTVDYKEFIAIIRHHDRLIKLELDGELKDVFIKAAQHDVLGDNILHADFEWINLDELVKVEVEIRLWGTPADVSTGGVLRQLVEDVEIEVPVKSIPEFLRVDISALTIGEKLTLGDIDLPEGASVVGDDAKPFVSLDLAVELPDEDEEQATPAEDASAEEAPAEE
jgi:large subunit ribosomal protein L25